MSRQSNMIPKQSQPPYMAEGAFINPACDLRLPTASLVPNNTPPDSSLLSAYSALTSSPDTFFPRPSHCIPKPSRHGYLTAFSNTGVNMSGARPLAAMKPGVETEPWKMPIHGPTATFPANTLLESGQRYSRLPPDNVARKVPRKASDGMSSIPLEEKLAEAEESQSRCEANNEARHRFIAVIIPSESLCRQATRICTLKIQ